MSSPISIVELHMDYCTRTFGIGACTASLGGQVDRKCFNTWNTCKLKSAFNKGTKVYSFIENVSGLPVGQHIPALKSVSARSGTVNIAGSDPRMDSLGVRATVTASFRDFVDNDTVSDKYQSERRTGAAQLSGVGYDPSTRGTFWGRFKARNPNYAGRKMVVKHGYVEDGIITIETERHFVITEFEGPDTNGVVTVKGKDVLDLAGNTKSTAPKASRGFLSADIDAVANSVTLLPAGVGAEYATSGWAVIGSEIVSFDRTGDVLTIGRGRRGTVAASHNVNDTVQETFSVRRSRIDDVIYDLLVNYAAIPASYIPVAEWEAEVDRWGGQLELSADICKPEGVSTLIGEMAVLGISIWWDEIAQKIRLRINRPPDVDTVKDIDDNRNIISAKQEDRDDDRLTRVSFWSVQIDPTKGLNKDNFLRQRLIIDVDAESEANYNGQRVKEIYNRWLNHGADNLVRILSRRLLNRFNRQPVLYEIKLDVKDDCELVDVLRLSSRVAQDDTGAISSQLMQVIKREDDRSGHSLKITAQKFQFDGRYGYVTENTRPVYSASTAAQKARGAYFVDENTLLFGDGTGPYVFS